MEHRACSHLYFTFFGLSLRGIIHLFSLACKDQVLANGLFKPDIFITDTWTPSAFSFLDTF